MSDKKLKYLFNPPQKEPLQLKAEFVVRTADFEQLFTDIQEDTMQHPPQHYMILGQRGMGKTTLLLRLKYAVLDDEKLNQWLLPVLFNEEQYSMPDLAAFFEHIAKILAEDHPAYETLLDEMRKREFEADYDQKAFEILVDYLKQNQQKIIVFHDNFGQFLEKIGKTATHRLRNILMNSPHLRLVGASATLLEHTFDYKEPFFDFFYQIRLKGMTADETITLFEKLAENEGKSETFQEMLKTQRPRIEVMRKLSGGVIRTMVMLFDVFMDNEKQDSFKDLEVILDRVTPLYKHRMDDLKPQQQLIVDAVARAWDAVTVSEIAELARSERQGLKTNQISAQLKQLVDNQIIEIEPRTTGRTHLYRLQERFFNIWYLMRYSTRQDKQRVIWFVKFLEGWCDTNDLKQLFERFENNLEKGTYELNTVFDRALAYSMVDNEEISNEKFKLIPIAINHLKKKGYDEKLLEILKNEYKNITRKIVNQLLDGTVFKVQSSKNRTSEYSATYLQRFIKQIEELEKGTLANAINALFMIIIHCLILNKISLSLQLIHKINTNLKIEDVYDWQWQELFSLLIAKKQYHTVHQLFEEVPQLKDRLKPIYFLTMEYLKDEYPNEYLKAGEEMRETIEELKERVKWFEDNLK
ncbi:ATP-binding protein [Runella aurantiaca]|uniref:ATP-binding protein n=1 Tax=Runella aurantiaca TaxID=2282308 RepID=A0A369IGR0_9BACT|nr:ATP-binding protein [Runella aurantiaca]RDB07537.1 ATP-binding protein [Runella aurantiaca]